jgi:predicted DNA-binding protein YlxM (UPF0122 family)
MIDVCVNPRRLTEQGWTDVRLEYETDPNRISLRELADKYHISRSTIFKRAARERWKQNAALVEAARKQIVQKMEAKIAAATTEAAQLVTKQVVEELRPWIEREKSEHIRGPLLWENVDSNELESCGTAKNQLTQNPKALRRRAWINTTK